MKTKHMILAAALLGAGAAIPSGAAAQAAVPSRAAAQAGVVVERVEAPSFGASVADEAGERPSRVVRTLRGAGIGMVAGAAVGALAGATVLFDPCEGNEWLFCERSEQAGILAVFGGGVGLVIGGIVGATSPGEKKPDAPVAAFVAGNRVGVSVRP